MDSKDVHEIETEQKMNDRPSGLLDGNGNLSSAKTSLQVHKPMVQDLRLLFQGATFHRTSVRRLQTEGVFVPSPVQADPSGVIDSFAVHVLTPLCGQQADFGPARNPYG